MLQFYYEFLYRFLKENYFELAQMDTDSLYFGIGAEKLDDCVKETERQIFFETRHHWLPAERCDNCAPLYVETKMDNKPWVGCDDCRKHNECDQHTPGLFKLEGSADGTTALCSKAYYCFDNTNPSRDKHTAKRVQSLRIP